MSKVHIWIEAERVLLVVGSVPTLFWLWLCLVLEYQTLFFFLKKQYLRCFKMLLLWLNVDHFEINIQERLWDKKCWMEFGFVATFSEFGGGEGKALNPVYCSSLSEMASFFQQ